LAAINPKSLKLAPTREPYRPFRVINRLGPEGVAQLVTDYESGLTAPELQEKYNLSRGSVLGVLKEAGVSMRRKPLASEQVAKVMGLYETGLSIREMAAKRDLAKTTVQDALRRSGTVMRPAVRLPRIR
jgi:lambda repressor-like predicted transcriptional regulator